MNTVYIASPYSIGDQAENVRNSLIAADELLLYGYAPYCPLLSHFWHMLIPHDHKVWMKLDTEWVRRCDALLRLPGKSKGADMEVKLARKLGKPVFMSIRELICKFPNGS